MDTSILMRRAARSIGALLGVLVLGCNGGPTDPEGLEDGPLRITPLLESAVDPALLDLDAIHVTIREAGATTVLSDTVMAYDADDETVLGWILGLETLPADVRVDAVVRSAGTVMFAGSMEMEVVDTPPGASAPVQDVSLAFVGPGSDAVSIAVSPVDSLVTFSDTLRYDVTGIDADGNTISDVVAVWSSSDAELAPISGEALLSAPEERGTVSVSAMTPTGLSDSTDVVFQPAASSLVVVEGDGVSVPVHSSVPLEVQVVGADGEGVADAEVSFAAPSGASIRDGMVTTGSDGHAETVGVLGASTGLYTFTASSPGMPSVTLEVTAEPGPAAPGTATIEADPTEVEADGDAASAVTVQLYDAEENPLTEGGDEVTLATDLGELTEVVDQADGTYTAELRSAAEGAATVTGTLNGEPIDDQASVTFTSVEPVVASVEVSPEADTLDALGATLQFTGVARDADGAEISDVTFTWSVAAESIAVIDTDTGIATSVDNGTTTVTATADGISGTASLTVDQRVSTLDLSKQCVDGAEACEPLTSFDDQVQIVADARDTNGHPVDAPEIIWTSDDTTVATVDETGLVTATGNGTTLVHAAADDATAQIDITVRQEVDKVKVEPSAITLSATEEEPQTSAALVVGPAPEEQQLTASAYDANGYLIEDAEFTWKSFDESVATVDGNGLVTAVGSGSTTIRATSGERSGDAKVTVE